MKTLLVSTILGLAVVTASRGAEATVLFDTYAPHNYAAFAWSTGTGLAPAGRAGQQLSSAESQYFSATLWFGVGSTPSSWYQAFPSNPNAPSARPLTHFVDYPELGGGWVTAYAYPGDYFDYIYNVTGPGLPDYSDGPYAFRIVVAGSGPYVGAGGTFEFVEPDIGSPETSPYVFTQLPTWPPGEILGGTLMQVIILPEPSCLFMTGLGLLILVRPLRRRCFYPCGH